MVDRLLKVTCISFDFLCFGGPVVSFFLSAHLAHHLHETAE
jgi:hypothetical protein